MKKIKLILCITACLFALNGCSILAESKPVDPETTQRLEKLASSLISGIFMNNDQQSADYLASLSAEEFEMVFEEMGVYLDGEAMKAGVESWGKAAEQLGNVTNIKSASAEYDAKGTSIIVTITVAGDRPNSLGEPREANVEFVFKDDIYKTITSCTTNVTLTFAEKMENAGLNTLIGMGTVFSILILLCLIISCFGIFPKIEKAMQAKKEKNNAVIDQPIKQIIEKEEMSEEEDEGELVAVITAAIVAFESANGVPVSTDDFVVRTIKRRR